MDCTFISFIFEKYWTINCTSTLSAFYKAILLTNKLSD